MISSAFWVPAADRIATADFMGPLRTWSRTWAANTLTLGDETTIASDSTVFTSVHEVDGMWLVGHANGAILVASES